MGRAGVGGGVSGWWGSVEAGSPRRGVQRWSKAGERWCRGALWRLKHALYRLVRGSGVELVRVQDVAGEEQGRKAGRCHWPAAMVGNGSGAPGRIPRLLAKEDSKAASAVCLTWALASCSAIRLHQARGWAETRSW